MKSLLREPLVHFLALGAALFVIFSIVGNKVPAAAPKPKIVVTPERVEQLVNFYKVDFKRAPTPAEVDKLIDDYIREEVLCQEAWALKIDRDEPRIRLQLRQLMEARNADHADLSAPTDEQLQAFVDAHPEMFRKGDAPPVLGQVRNSAVSALMAARRKAAQDAAYDRLKSQYVIVIDRPTTRASATAPTTSAGANP